MKRSKSPQIVHKTSGAQITAPDMPGSVRDFFRATGRLGGSAKSPAKAKAARENGKLGGRPRKQPEALPESKVLAPSQGSKDSPLHQRR